MEYIAYENPAPGVARVVLNRPQAHNAQNPKMLDELNQAFDRALHDDSVKVIILAANGKHFSAGHDLTGTIEGFSTYARDQEKKVGTWSGFTAEGPHGLFASEQEIYLQSARRIRNIAKPTIAQVQGKAIAGALNLIWVCDLIVAADNAKFSDPVVTFGVLGVEWFAHPYELGPRKAKEFLFTSEEWSAEEAWRLGMVNRVVPLAELEAQTLALAQKIATKPAFALKLAKEAVNKSTDLQGQQEVIDHAFALHHLCHAHNTAVFGWAMDPTNAPSMSNVTKKAAAE